MQVKIFTHFGRDAVAELEKQINDWLLMLPAHGEMRHTSTAITVTDGKPSYIVAVWWQPHNGHPNNAKALTGMRQMGRALAMILRRKSN